MSIISQSFSRDRFELGRSYGTAPGRLMGKSWSTALLIRLTGGAAAGYEPILSARWRQAVEWRSAPMSGQSPDSKGGQA
jgi:hypothetical protein